LLTVCGIEDIVAVDFVTCSAAELCDD